VGSSARIEAVLAPMEGPADRTNSRGNKIMMLKLCFTENNLLAYDFIYGGSAEGQKTPSFSVGMDSHPGLLQAFLPLKTLR